MVTKSEEVTSPALPEVRSEIAIQFTLNGTQHESAFPCDLLLVDFLRDHLGLTGAKFGCETGQCGACTVLLDGVSIKSCAVLAAQVHACEVSTIEGVAPGNALTPLQTSLRENHADQCGYCTPGIVLSLSDLLKRNPHPEEAEIRRWLDGTLCRCGVYQNVVKAVLSLPADGK